MLTDMINRLENDERFGISFQATDAFISDYTADEEIKKYFTTSKRGNEVIGDRNGPTAKVFFEVKIYAVAKGKNVEDVFFSIASAAEEVCDIINALRYVVVKTITYPIQQDRFLCATVGFQYIG
jgi:hypothetical protein